MRVVVAMDKFKGSLTAVAACEAVRAGLLAGLPSAEIICRPMADGGEGTADVLMVGLGGEWVEVIAMGPRPNLRVEAGYAWLPGKGRSVVEMAAASGMVLLPPHARDPIVTTTFGTGELLAAAFDRRAPVWLAVGGSATVDGGVGAAMALGWKFLDRNGRDIGLGGGALEKLHSICPPEQADYPGVEVLCDVDNPLCGEQGAARVFGPQKGATPAMVARLEAGLERLAECVREVLGKDIRNLARGGAAGGLAAGAVAFFNARLVSGIDTVIEAIGLKSDASDADWVITGEGSFDEQSLRGKVVAGVLQAARAAGARVAVIAGRVALSEPEWRACGVETAIPLRTTDLSEDYAIAHAAEMLDQRTRELSIVGDVLDK
jgi:glycerate kinase